MKRKEKGVQHEVDEKVCGRRSSFSIAAGGDTMRLWQAAKILKLLLLQLRSNSGCGFDPVDGEGQGNLQ